MKYIKNQTFDSERALYESCDLTVFECGFCGVADGESALKESNNIAAEKCYFDLRYPFWHARGVTVTECEMTEKCRAPLWYSSDVKIFNSVINGTKAIRECNGVIIGDTKIVSDEIGWDTHNINVENSEIKSQYAFMRSRNITLENVKLTGKYSLQYIENAKIANCDLNTKDSLWHAKNVTVKNSVIKGEYLGWYSENVTFENCVIIGTQPLCYCKNLKLINCQMLDCDLAFEKSTVNAEITTPVISIKNVLSGKITVPCVDEIIVQDERYKGEIIQTDN